MPESLFLITKGRIITNADLNLRHPTHALYEGLRAIPRMSDRAALPEFGVLRESDKPHVDDEFFGKKWWPEIQHKEDIVREGYLKAMKLSLAHAIQKPIVSYWITGLPKFEVMVAESDHQITVFLLTPLPPEPQLPPAEKTYDENLWLIAAEERIAELRDAHPAAYEMAKLEEPTTTVGIRCLRAKGF
ncbi:MAG TPA: hypothetical protein VFD92_20140 [Candidatus Binatia bacterium]|nr:hypothetical protein [Candidatus Binatia bacterium]